jgi:uncharacterized protein
MSAPFNYKLLQNNFWLSPERMVYWEEETALIVSDLHFGKTGHFRKEGIAVPPSVYKEDLQRLISQLQHFQPKQLLVVGDMFHSRDNKELDFFKKWRNDFSHLNVQLIRGNHDILHDSWYQEAGVKINNEVLKINNFSFMHDIAQEKPGSQSHIPDYTFSGHLHPGVRISGAGKQSLCFPCFYFTRAFCVLPAFSRFTGLATIRQEKEDVVFAIVNKSIIQI